MTAHTRRFRVAIDPYRSSGIPVDVLYQLADMAPRRDEWKTRLTMSAYVKGFDAGADYSVSDSLFPDCPYQERHAASNFARGRNDPGAAWRAGSLDGQRFRKMMTDPAHLSPELRWREYKLLPESLQKVVDSARAVGDKRLDPMKP